jgi:mannose-1-phosphate guanylyltransferase
MNALVLAAGLGTRFRPFTDTLPKPAIPLLNVPIAFYNVHLLQQLGIEHLTINTHHLPAKIKDIIGKQDLGASIFFSDEEGQILGTGGAVKKARPSLEGRGTFVVANADVVNGFGIRDALENHHRVQPMATMIVMSHPEVGKKYGAVWVNKDMEVVGISKKKPPEVECEPFHFVGIHLIEESVFKYIPDGPYEITKVYLDAIKEGEEVLAFKKEGLWFDAGTLQDYLKATSSLLEILPRLQHEPYFLSLYRRFWPNFDKRPNLWEGQDCYHLLGLGPKSQILMGDFCKVHNSVKTSGFAVFGNNVVIEKDVELENVVVASGVKIPAGQKLKNTLVL